MKRPFLAVALALAVWAAAEKPAQAWRKTQVSFGFNYCHESTGWTRTFNYCFSGNPPPGCAYGGGGGPTLFDAGQAYGSYGGAAAYPAPTSPYIAPQPTPAATAPKATGAQQVGYYPQTGYGYGYGTNYGAGYGSGYGYGYGNYQAPSYWYGN